MSEVRRAPDGSGEQVAEPKEPDVIVPLPDMVPTQSELPSQGCPVMAGTDEAKHDVL